MRLNSEPVAVSLDFDEPVQSYCVEEVEFHEAVIACKNANVRFPPIPDSQVLRQRAQQPPALLIY